MSVLSSVFLIFGLGYLCYTNKDPDSLIKLLSYVAVYVGAFIGGFIASRLNKQSGVLSGLAVGGMFMAFIVMLFLN